ncbi:MAG TPA: hypothetical protein DD649_18550 [Providencia sp.]|uniref:YncE family protein n=1 Tax=Providencia sp. TaxID=589 RepID=UPI000E89D022|nr:hypothetical protein [Providencia sp.]HBO24861.1 hypothetical protein [Providencia sp.]
MSQNPEISYPYLLLLDAINPAIIQLDTTSLVTFNLIDELGGTPDGIAIDHINRLIYWTNMGDNYEADDGSLNLINFDGSGRKMLLGHGQLRTPKQLLLESQSQRLYWCDREGGKVCSCKTDGTDLQTHIRRPRTVTDSVDILDQCVGIALDLDANWLYWTQKGPAKGNKGRIFRMPLSKSSGDFVDESDADNIQLLLDKLPEPIDLLFDKETQILYWTDRGSEPNGNSLNCANVTDDGLNNYRVICRGFKEAIGLAYNKPENIMYIADLSGGVYRVMLSNGQFDKIHQGNGYTGLAQFSG